MGVDGGEAREERPTALVRKFFEKVRCWVEVTLGGLSHLRLWRAFRSIHESYMCRVVGGYSNVNYH